MAARHAHVSSPPVRGTVTHPPPDANLAADTSPKPTRTPVSRYAAHATAILLIGVLVAAGAWTYRRSLHTPSTIPGLLLENIPVGSVHGDALGNVIGDAAERLGAVPIRLLAENRLVQSIAAHQLGARVNVDATRDLLQAIGRSGHLLQDALTRIQALSGRLSVPLVIDFDRDRALAFFRKLKEKVDRDPSPARLDMERGRVIEGRIGHRLRVHDSLAASTTAVRSGHQAVSLVFSETGRARATRYAGLHIGQVLGRFDTVYSLADKDTDRAHNLRVGATKLDGFVLDPHGTFSFNDVVGARTEAEGYRMAPVINQGELIDGMAGGSCQLSSTLFAASFFAGLDLVRSRPHTMPSSYIKMGLDAAVAYPGTDLVIRNPYPFPVVFNLRVNRGRVQARVLGRNRPWSRIAFERKVIEQQPFERVERPDPNLPDGVQLVAQRGVPGFTIERRRLFFGSTDKGASPDKVDRRVLRYPPTAEIVRSGVGAADPDFAVPPPRPPFGSPKEELTISY